MSIHVFTGVPGSGKSAHAARLIREQLNRRYPRPVIANFPLSDNANIPPDSRALYKYVPNGKMSASKIITICEEYWRENPDRDFCEDYILLVLDECQLLFNSRLWAQSDRLSYLSFLSQSRKMGVMVILIAQSVQMIDNQFRMLIEVEVSHRRLSTFGPIGAALNFLSLSQCFICVRTLYQIHERLGFDIMRLSKSDMSMYDTVARFHAVAD